MGKFREVFMDYGQNGTPDYPRYLWQNSVNTWNWGSKVTIALEQSSLPSEALYDFEKMTLLDDAVYGTLDIFGVISGIDTFTDPIGAAYAMARSDVENATIYSVSAVTPLVGAAYVRGGAKALSKAEPAVALVAKKADNTDGFELVYKSVNDIQANEFYVASAIDGKQSQEFLEQTQKYLDKNAIKKQVDKLAKTEKYTTKIRWGAIDIDARPFGKGYFGKRIKQTNPRVEAYELKINPNNESFYLWNSIENRYVQFENISENMLQDGKCVLTPENSIYRVYDKPEFLRKNILKEARTQVVTAQQNGLKVEWLVSDEVAREHLQRFFNENNSHVV